MPAILDLLGRDPITYESACKSESNIINKLGYVSAAKHLFADLWMQRRSIAALTKHHLGLGPEDSCTVLYFPEWMRGSFNACIPVEIKSGGVTRKLVFRCPMPHKLAESRYAGTVNEKLHCEVATRPPLYAFQSSPIIHPHRTDYSPLYPQSPPMAYALQLYPS
ncbi:uncharacterized protein HRG_04247 [Hirsutella rhossiliensis]|uniref:Uncharacterized protein n=1 Tax=Hirsutella rhossiliensis TaxID=111463 RepID=A0A9P8MYZ6_9HYPO|nr:uncharacterized protein HRG_04247 [Hirsutella rhossiliensis]KAH0963819.1 hypothetical protein HRG_04247 [Hirsutella rhossiliensis]